LRIALVASARYPLRQPFPGGLEAHTWQLARQLEERGHDVCVFASPGSDPDLHIHEMAVMPALSAYARRDVSMPPEYFLAEHFAYLSLMTELARDDSYDIVHNNSLHYLPIAMAENLNSPMLTTLHTPPTPWLESAMVNRPLRRIHYAAVSQATANQWAPIVANITVVLNGVDLDHWTFGAGGGTPVWYGRIVPEKGLEFAIGAARSAGTGLRIAGPCPDLPYYQERILPLIAGDIEYLGHLDHVQLAILVGSASVVIVSPCWDEPYGLVVAESLACGTPVAGFARGALPELIDGTNGILVAADDVDALAGAVRAASRIDRGAVRRSAERNCSLASMVDGYESLYHRVVA
jgi:glycosyltransferase involved in cell wall biosynthesis